MVLVSESSEFDGIIVPCPFSVSGEIFDDTGWQFSGYSLEHSVFDECVIVGVFWGLIIILHDAFIIFIFLFVIKR